MEGRQRRKYLWARRLFFVWLEMVWFCGQIRAGVDGCFGGVGDAGLQVFDIDISWADSAEVLTFEICLLEGVAWAVRTDG